MSRYWKGAAAITASAFGFAIMAACVRWCDDFGQAIPCFEKSFFRNAIAFVIAAFAFVRSPARTFSIGGIAWTVLLSRCVMGTIGIFANFYALSKIPIADGQTLNKTAPFFTVVFAFLFLGERATFRQMLAVAIAFLGALLVARPGFAGDDSFPLAIGLLGGIAAGGAYAAVRSLGRRDVDPVLIVFAFSAFSCIVSIPFTMAVYVPLSLTQCLVLAGAGAGAAIGQFGITLAYRYAAPKEIAVFDYTNILFTAILGYALFGQVSDCLSIAGMLIIVFAAFVLRR